MIYSCIIWKYIYWIELFNFMLILALFSLLISVHMHLTLTFFSNCIEALHLQHLSTHMFYTVVCTQLTYANPALSVHLTFLWHYAPPAAVGIVAVTCRCASESSALPGISFCSFNWKCRSWTELLHESNLWWHLLHSNIYSTHNMESSVSLIKSCIRY